MTLLGAGTAALPAAAAPATGALSATRSAGTSVEVTAVPADRGVVGPDEAVPVRITVENTGTTTVPAGTVSLSYSSRQLQDRAQLDDWLTGADESSTPKWLGQTTAEELRPGERETITTVSIDPEALQLAQTLPAAGSYRMTVHYAADDVSVFERSSFVWRPDEDAAQPEQRVVVAAPVTVPADGVGTIPADDLARYTAVNGTLSRQLDALENRDVAIGIDPRIIVSIRVLGSTAPDAAVDWLERLADIDNEVFPLQYGDADAALTVAAAAENGSALESLPEPGSFEYAIDPANFVDADPGLIPTLDPSPAGRAAGESSATPSATPSEEPAPEPDAEDLPSREQLLDWDYATSSVVWPSSGTVTASGLSVFSGPEGDVDTIVSSAQISPAEGASASAAARVGDAGTLVSDAALSAHLMAAAAAPSAQARDEAVNELSQVLGVIASAPADPSAEPAPLLLTAERSWVDNTSAFGDAVDELAGTDGVTLEGITSLAEDERAAATLTEGSFDADVVAPAAELLAGQDRLTAFSSALDPADADEMLGRERAQLLALLADGWRDDPEGWAAAVAAHETQTKDTLGAVTLVTVSQINVISGQASLPFTVRNDLAYPVTITLSATPDNPRLTVDPETTTTIAAGAHSSLPLGVKARLGNGDVVLSVQLSTESGVAVGEPTEVMLNVRADWEGIGILVLGSLVGLLFVGGLIRTVRRRRAARPVAAAAQAPGDDASTDETTISTGTGTGTDETSTDSTPGETPRG
ncbi:hypothetical protein D9V30_10135 [Mycetocola reblochoni]|uniref:Secreted protein n=2 Tax=Mycetocola reblochoni TaxID=331618 RepID=A0A1R4JNH0_9MICO|nr:hypothetical protein D9V30_10135 [Mycetocola reblochoni]SJN33600.1 hypothetical protein FM119_08510 [Mycetocola reblochoni REB411]